MSRQRIFPYLLSHHLRSGEVGVGDGEREVLGHLVPADDGTGLEGNLGGALQWLLGAANPVLDFGKVALALWPFGGRCWPLPNQLGDVDGSDGRFLTSQTDRRSE
jgi:hypothetical protein